MTGRGGHPMVKRIGLVGGLVGMLVTGWAFAGTPFGGDDSGFIPPTKDIAKCEDSVGKSLGKAAACILGCHKKRAKGSLADETAEDECEKGATTKSCLGKYTTATGKLTCPPCLDKAGLFAFAESNVDAVNGSVYCASPSGAFLD